MAWLHRTWLHFCDGPAPRDGHSASRPAPVATTSAWCAAAKFRSVRVRRSVVRRASSNPDRAIGSPRFNQSRPHSSAGTAAAAVLYMQHCCANAARRSRKMQELHHALGWIFWLGSRAVACILVGEEPFVTSSRDARLDQGLTVSVAACILARPSFLRANRRPQRAAPLQSLSTSIPRSLAIAIVAMLRRQKRGPW